jgi:hypothetical protein
MGRPGNFQDQNILIVVSPHLLLLSQYVSDVGVEHYSERRTAHRYRLVCGWSELPYDATLRCSLVDAAEGRPTQVLLAKGWPMQLICHVERDEAMRRRGGSPQPRGTVDDKRDAVPAVKCQVSRPSNVA